jgi:hypothetical protein
MAPQNRINELLRSVLWFLKINFKKKGRMVKVANKKRYVDNACVFVDI